MKVVIIGGSTSGMGVAAKLKRNDSTIEIVVIQKEDYVSLSACGLPYFVGGIFEDINNLYARTIVEFQKQDIKVINNSQATAINFENKIVKYKKIHSSDEFEINYDQLVIATGAKPKIFEPLSFNYTNILSLTSIQDAKVLKNILTKSKNIVVVGAGFIGLEITEQLSKLNKKVYLIEAANQLLLNRINKDFSEELENNLKEKNVEIRLSTSILNVSVNDNEINKIKLSDASVINTDLIINATGFIPNVDWINDEKLIKDQKTGAIVVDEYGKTSIADVWSLGDCVVLKNKITDNYEYLPLATVANKFAKIVADNICGKNLKFPGQIGSALIRVNQLEIYRTGLTEEHAISLGIKIKKVLVKDFDHTNFVEEKQTPLWLEVIIDNNNKQIIGASMLGQNKSVLRLNGLVSMIWNRQTIIDNNNIDFAYAPPFTRSVDIINIAFSLLLK
ncbi:FAD-dependent oxidoreductase [Spiroplasma endosymbiont of Labia minor]|uniref:FAD-dependent oxidoreductase n=1 Tax=Spiroplasma endosymbiont of Labia minor TaxID=3066305 RepID=UPI0030D0AAEF